MELIGTASARADRRLEPELRVGDQPLLVLRLATIAAALAFLALFRDELPRLPILIAILAAVAAYTVLIPMAGTRLTAREAAFFTAGLDMVAVTVAISVAAEAVDAYLLYGLVILGLALRFGLAVSVWASLVVSALYLIVVTVGTDPGTAVRGLLPIRVAYLLGFGVLAGLFSRVVAARAADTARLQLRLSDEERERSRAREREMLSRLGRDFGASLERGATVEAIVAGSAHLLGDATLVWLVEDETLVVHGVGGRDTALVERLRAGVAERRLLVGEGIAGGAAASSTTLIASIADDDGGASADPDGLADLGLGWVLAVPIVAGGQVVAVLSAVGRAPRDRPVEAVSRLAEAIAERAGPALQNVGLWADLQQQMARVQQAQRIKDDFLSIVSHELRTPLTSIQGYAQLLESRLRASAGVGGKEIAHLRVIRSQVTRMRRLVDDLLDVSRIDRRGISIEPTRFDLAELVRDEVARVGRAHPLRDVRLEAPGVLEVPADRERLDQVVSNLLDNAVKYSPRGGPIEVVLAQHGDQAELRVADRGIGLASDQLPMVFERFYQADADISRRRFGGLGLGLYISRAIVEAHGGRIHAEANAAAGHGTVFVVRLPLKAGVPPAVLPHAGEPPPFVVRGGDAGR